MSGGRAALMPWHQEPGVLLGHKPTGPVSVDFSHPLANGLQMCVPFNGGSVEIVEGRSLKFNNAVLGGDARFLRNARYVPDGAVGDNTDCRVDRYYPVGSGLTALCVFSFSSVNTGTAGLLNQYYGFTETQRSWVIGLTTGAKLTASLSSDGSYQGVNDTTGATTLQVNTEYAAVLAWDSDSTELYLDGVQDATNGTAPASLHSSEYNLRIGGPQYFIGTNLGAGTTVLEGMVFSAFLWDRKLTPEEIQRVSRNPYQFLKPAGP